MALILAAVATTAAAQGAAAVSGGVSLDSREQLRKNPPPHTVKMIFSLTSGNYVSDVAVKVTDSAKHAVIDMVSDGPWLFANLPAGSYTATATYHGKAITQRISVGKSGARSIVFRWPPSVDSDSKDAGILGTGPQEMR